MFESHFGLRENPFASGHQSRFVYPSHELQEALAHLRYGIENHEPFVLITGEVGTGKTTALFEALSELQARVSVALITNSTLKRDELLEEICLRFGVVLTSPVTKPQAVAQLERHLLALRGRSERAILVLDEAQNFDPDLLEDIRLLSNLEAGGEKLLQIFLVGQPELEAKLSRPELRQLRQRIGVHYRLRPLNLEETERYIQHRVSVAGGDAPGMFPPATCAEVHAVTNGIPREINQICAQALLDAYVDGALHVDSKHVRSAAAETTFQSVLPASDIDPRLAPLPAWPAALPPRLPETPTTAAAPQTGTEASRWEAWVSSLGKQTETGGAGPESPAPPAPTPQEVQKPEPARERPAQPAPTPVAEPREPEPAAEPPRAAPATRYAAESALEPPVTGAPRAADWRPPLWTPEGSAGSAGGTRTPPSRLYDRMRDAEPEPPSHAGLKWLIGIAVLAVVAISALLVFRFGPWTKHERPVPPPVALLPTDTMPAWPGDSTAASEDTTATASETPELMAPVVRPPVRAAAKPVVATPAPAPVMTQEFGIAVGAFLDRARAQTELARIAGASGLTGRLAEVSHEGTVMYTVVIGAFPDRDAAERKASELVSLGTVDEARILSRTVSAKP